jgi:hypothetical protein
MSTAAESRSFEKPTAVTVAAATQSTRFTKPWCFTFNATASSGIRKRHALTIRNKTSGFNYPTGKPNNRTRMGL